MAHHDYEMRGWAVQWLSNNSPDLAHHLVKFITATEKLGSIKAKQNLSRVLKVSGDFKTCHDEILESLEEYPFLSPKSALTRAPKRSAPPADAPGPRPRHLLDAQP